MVSSENVLNRLAYLLQKSITWIGSLNSEPLGTSRGQTYQLGRLAGYNQLVDFL
jgi:hypothetical protein